MKEFQLRYRHVEVGQTNLKQKLVEFNNFVKEKKEKVADGKLKVKLAKNSQSEMETKIANLILSKEMMQACLDSLQQSIEKKRKYFTFVELVAKQNCQNTEEFLHQKSALMDLKTKLETILTNLTKESEDVNKNLKLFKEQRMKDTLLYSTKLGIKQRVPFL